MSTVDTPKPARRPSSRAMGWSALLLAGLLAFIALPDWLLAAETRTGSDVVIEASEAVSNDLYLAGGTVDFLGRAERDVSIAAGQATIDGTIRGSLNLASGQATITGPVSGSIRVLAGRVTISGNVGGDVVVLGGQLTVTSSARINGSVLVAGGELDMRGRVAGDVEGTVGSVSIGGTVEGNVDVSTGNLDISNTARITGPVTVTGKRDANVASGAEVPGGVSHNDVDPWSTSDSPFEAMSGGLLRTLWMLVTGGLIVLVGPRVAQMLSKNGQRIIPALPLGLLSVIALPLLAVVLMVTVIGFPAGMILLVLLGVGLYVTQAVAGMAIGRLFLPASWNDGSRGFLLLAMTIGVLVIAVFRFLPVPWVWAVVSAIVTLWGLGAIVMLVPQLGRRSAQV